MPCLELHLPGSRLRKMESLCEHGNETSASRKVQKIADQSRTLLHEISQSFSQLKILFYIFYLAVYYTFFRSILQTQRLIFIFQNFVNYLPDFALSSRVRHNFRLY